MNLIKDTHVWNSQTINKRCGRGSKCSCQQEPLWNSDGSTAFGNLPTKGSKSPLSQLWDTETPPRVGAALNSSPRKSGEKRSHRANYFSNKSASFQMLFWARLVLLKIVAQFHKRVGAHWSQLLKYCIPSVPSNAQSTSLKFTCQAMLSEPGTSSRDKTWEPKGLEKERYSHCFADTFRSKL